METSPEPAGLEDEADVMMSLSDAVRYLGTFRPNVYGLIATRRLQAYRMVGRPKAIYLLKRDVDAIRPLLGSRAAARRAAGQVVQPGA